MRQLWTFLTQMDAKAARALWVSVALFVAAGIILLLGKTYLDLDQGPIAAFLGSLRNAWWAPVAVTGTFCVLAFVGAPQIALIAATVAVFGPAEGMLLSWIATMISACVGFAMGRGAGAGTLARIGGAVAERAQDFMGRNGVFASFVIRLVPSGPFIIVNMALGAARVRWSHFLAGTGVGIGPKIALVATAGHGFGALQDKESMTAIAYFIGAIVIWLGLVVVARPWLKKAMARSKVSSPPAS